MTSRVLLVAVSTLLLAACLKGEAVPNTGPNGECRCDGLRCSDSKVARLTPSDPDEPCFGCNVRPVASCAEGCGTETKPVDGCPVGFLCQTWTRVAEGAACTADRDCEPGARTGNRAAQLSCTAGKCTVNGAKFSKAIPAQECAGAPEFGPHPECPSSATCVPVDDFQARRFCASGKCINDEDCPTLWRCRCAEETTADGIKAHRYCVPDLARRRTDAGYPQGDVVPLNRDAGLSPLDAGRDSGTPGPDAAAAGPDAAPAGLDASPAGLDAAAAGPDASANPDAGQTD